MNHFRPLTTQVLPLFSTVVSIAEGSEPDPGAGSVMAKDERASPSAIGWSHRSFWALVPILLGNHIAVVGRSGIETNRAKIERFISS